MKQKPKTKYSANRELMKELEKNPKIMDAIKEHIHIDDAIINMEHMEKLHPDEELYEMLYDEMVSVGKYDAPVPSFIK